MAQHEGAGALWTPAEWREDLARLERDYAIEHPHVHRLQGYLLQSRTLRELVEAPDPGPRLGWLCFLALVDVYIDPEGPGLPLPGIHPPRLSAPPYAVFDDFLVDPGRQGFVRHGTPPGDAQGRVMKHLRTTATELRMRAEMMSTELKKAEAALHARFPSGEWTAAQRAEFQAERYAIVLGAAEPRILSEAADLIERRLGMTGPRVWKPDAGDLREGPSSLMQMLDFTLSVNVTLSKPDRERLIASVVAEFFPGSLSDDPAAAKEQVRKALVEARRRAERAHEKAAAKGTVPLHAHPTFACRRLMEAGILNGRMLVTDVARKPYGRGVRFVLETACRRDAKHVDTARNPGRRTPEP
jgi:hypothetical protein